MCDFPVHEAFPCPADYTQNKATGDCYKFYSTPSTRFEALKRCQIDGAILYPILNNTDNENLKRIALDKIRFVWTGLTCVNTLPISCYTDEGQPADYSNFQHGSANINGACVILDTNSNTGTWLDSTCNYKAPFVCKYTGNIDPEVCDQGSWLFNGHCYSVHSSAYSYLSEEICASFDGHLASIHSIGENNFITDLVYNSIGNSEEYFRIGLIQASNGSYIWSDHSSFNFNNSQVSLRNRLCIAVSIDGSFVQKGKWFSTECNVLAPSVCKKGARVFSPPLNRLDFLCDSSPTHLPLSLEGTFWSPNYPNSYTSTQCNRELTWDTSIQPTLYIQFPELYLAEGDWIYLYNAIVSKTSFANITYNSNLSRVYSVDSGEFKIEFYGENSDNGLCRFRGVTSFTKLDLNAPDFLTNCGTFIAGGQFKSINYGTLNPSNTPCSILLMAKDETKTFIDFYIGPDDFVNFYDGQNSNATKITSLSGAQPGLVIESTGQYLLLETNGISGNYRGFWGDFISN